MYNKQWNKFFDVDIVCFFSSLDLKTILQKKKIIYISFIARTHAYKEYDFFV